MLFLGMLQLSEASFFKKFSSLYIRNKIAFYDELAQIAWHDGELFKNKNLLSFCNRLLDYKNMQLFPAGIKDCNRRVVIPYLQEKWICQTAYAMGLPSVRLLSDVDGSIPIMFPFRF